MGGPVWSRNSIVSCWSECLSSLQCHHQCEPRDRYTTSDSRADIVVFESGSGGTAELDVALARPWSQDVLPSSANTDGAAARRREEIKHKKYSHPLFLLSWSTSGDGDKKRLTISISSLGCLGPNPSDFKTHWRRRLSVQLERCNARVIARKMARAASGRQSVQGLDTAQFLVY